MPVKLKIDWNLAYNLFNQGLTYKDIAQQLGCKEASLRGHGARHKWSDHAQAARQAVAKVVTNMLHRETNEELSIQKQAEAWVNVTARDIKRTAETLINLPVPGNLDGLRKHEEVWGMHVKRGRSTFGLDQQGTNVQINIGMSGQLSAVEPVPIDIEPVPPASD